MTERNPLLTTVGTLRKQLAHMSDDDIILYDTWYKSDLLDKLFEPDEAWKGKTKEEVSDACDQFIIWINEEEPYPACYSDLDEAYLKWMQL